MRVVDKSAKLPGRDVCDPHRLCFESSGLRLRSAGRSPSRAPRQGDSMAGSSSSTSSSAPPTRAGPRNTTGRRARRGTVRAPATRHTPSPRRRRYLGRFIVSHGHLAAFNPYILETRPGGSEFPGASISAGGVGAGIKVKLAVTTTRATSAAAAPARVPMARVSQTSQGPYTGRRPPERLRQATPDTGTRQVAASRRAPAVSTYTASNKGGGRGGGPKHLKNV